jgi:hypothetical protein
MVEIAMSYPLGPWNAWVALSAQVVRMCWEAQAVMFLRGLRMAQGGAKAEAEAQRMITEKVAATLSPGATCPPIVERESQPARQPGVLRAAINPWS